MNYYSIPEELKLKAKIIENELLNIDTVTNRHLKEERGIIPLKEDNEDEEFLYSSVYRTDQNK